MKKKRQNLTRAMPRNGSSYRDTTISAGQLMTRRILWSKAATPSRSAALIVRTINTESPWKRPWKRC